MRNRKKAHPEQNLKFPVFPDDEIGVVALGGLKAQEVKPFSR